MQNINRRHPGLIYKLSFLFAFIAVFTFLALRLPQGSGALSLSDFRPGNIISDYTMSNYQTMTVAEIDAFLHAHGNCNDRDIAKASSYPNVHYHIENGHFVCLADEVFTDGIEYGDLVPKGAKTRTAAQIIYDVAQEWKINPQVLLVLLEKEQGLISDSWPNSVQYRSATGFGCPDTAPCNEVYYGFYNQLDNAAYLFRTVLDGGWTNYPLGKNYIAYSPNSSCGGSIVNIENLATSSLYRYTPYQPNAAALAAGYGTATCGAYGNRNFFLFFIDWFGDPTVTFTPKFEPFLEPRYLELKNDAKRINPFTLDTVDTLKKGQILKYTSKIHLSSGWCYRTENNDTNNIDACVMASDLKEITFTYEDVPISEQEKVVVAGAQKVALNSGAAVLNLSEYIVRKFLKKTTFLGTTYYITQYDVENTSAKYGIPEGSLVDSYEPLKPAETKVIAKTSNRIDPFSNKVYDTLEKGRILTFTSSITINGKQYYRTEHNTQNSINAAIDVNLLEDLTADFYENFENPREMIILKTAERINLFTRERYDVLQKGRVIKFSTKIFINGQWYYRTEHNTIHGIDAIVPASAVGEI